MKILLIEDDAEISNFIKNNLIEDAFSVEIARDGAQGSFLARTNAYDLIIIDYSLPLKNGLIVCEEIRAAEIEIPILFLTIHNEIKKKVMAFEKGADDYMIKPFALEELKARIHALKRRPHKIENQIITIGDLILNTYRQTVHRGDTQIYLTRKTYNLLEFLMRNKGKVVSRGALLEYVWSSESDPFSNTVEAHILNLRKRINIEGRKDFLKNLPGRGYIISED